jgi:hypothetical protein
VGVGAGGAFTVTAVTPEAGDNFVTPLPEQVTVYEISMTSS